MQRRLTITIADDKSTARIDFLPASGAAGSLTLTANHLLTLIRELGRMRLEMVRDVPIPDFDPKAVDLIFNTKWSVASQADALPQVSYLTFYHPSFGPIGFAIPHKQVSEIVRRLSENLQEAQTQSGRKLQ